MYLHIGSGIAIGVDDIVGIFDLDNSSYSHITREFLKKAQQKNDVEEATDDLPKSFVLTEIDGKQTVHLSQFTSITLMNRIHQNKI